MNKCCSKWKRERYTIRLGNDVIGLKVKYCPECGSSLSGSDSEECECKPLLTCVRCDKPIKPNLLCVCHKPIKQDKYVVNMSYGEFKKEQDKPQLPEKLEYRYSEDIYSVENRGKINQLIDCFKHHLKEKE